MSRDSYREDLQNPPSEGKSARDGFQVMEANEIPPMNEDISSNDGGASGDEPGID